MGWNSAQNTCPENILLHKLTNSRGRNGLTTSFQVLTMWQGISCSFLMIITHSCCALVSYYHQKAHLIPYHAVYTWNSVVNPAIPLASLTICNQKLSIFLKCRQWKMPAHCLQGASEHVGKTGKLARKMQCSQTVLWQLTPSASAQNVKVI